MEDNPPKIKIKDDPRQKNFVLIIQELGVGPGYATERWPCKKTPENQLFSPVKKHKNYLIIPPTLL